MENKAIYTKTYEINTFTANSAKRLGLLGLGGVLQDAAAYHAEANGFGLEEMLKLGSFWVLTKQSVKMKRWPELFKEIEVKTWTREPQNFYAYRDFEICCEGELIGDCSTTWVNLDARTRRPAIIPIDDLPITVLRDGVLAYETKKIVASKNSSGLELRKEFYARNSDLDLNRHVNNTKFAQWVLDSIPYEIHAQHKIEEYHINFLSEVHLGEEVRIYKDIENSRKDIHIFLGKKKDSDKPCFIVELKASAR